MVTEFLYNRDTNLKDNTTQLYLDISFINDWEYFEITFVMGLN